MTPCSELKRLCLERNMHIETETKMMTCGLVTLKYNKGEWI